MWLRKEAFGPKSPPFPAALPKATAWMNLSRIFVKRSQDVFQLSRSRVPDAVQRVLRCTAEPGPTAAPDGPRISSAPLTRCAASGERNASYSIVARMSEATSGNERDAGPDVASLIRATLAYRTGNKKLGETS